jgi:membrane protein
MAAESIDRLGRITTEPAPQDVGRRAEQTTAAEKVVVTGQVTNPEDTAKASAANRDHGGGSGVGHEIETLAERTMRMNTTTRGNGGIWAVALIAIVLETYRVRAHRRRREDASGGSGIASSDRGNGIGHGATKPTDIPKAGWWAILKRTWAQMSEDNVSMLAGGVAFFAMLSIFPALTAMVSLYGLIADPRSVEQQVAALGTVLPPEALGIISTWLHNLVQGPPQKFGISLIVSVALALWSARAGTGMLMTAVNICYGEKETRNFIRFNLQALALTVGLILFGILALALVAVMPVVLNFLPLPETWRTTLALVRWPILAGLVSVALAVVYRYAADRADPKWRWVTPGSVLVTVLWIAASMGFSVYVSSFGNYDQTYGSLGAVIILLFWFYITAYVILAGAELNAEIEHQTARDTTTKPERPMGRRGARMADTVAT